MFDRMLVCFLLVFVLPIGGLGVTGCDSAGGSDTGDSTIVDTDTALPDATGDTDTALPDASGDTDIGPVPDWGDDEALVAWLGSIVATCPPTSLSTAPGLWKMTRITDYGCTVRHPEEWVTVLQPGSFEVTSDASRQVGYSVVGTYLSGTDWSETTLGDYLVTELRKNYPDLVVLAATTTTDPYGLGTRFRVLVLKFALDGTRSLGVAKVLFAGCSAVLDNCALTASITWAPAVELPIWACMLAQIEATLHCPSGGGYECEEDDCNTSCIGQGKDGGTCVGDSCMCY